MARFSKFFRPILRRRLRALSESDDEKSVVVSFSRETKLTDENVPPPPPPPLDANSQVEEETNPQIETQAQKDAHEIEVIFLTQNERKRFQNR